jgi:hypothetical protein
MDELIQHAFTRSYSMLVNQLTSEVLIGTAESIKESLPDIGNLFENVNAIWDTGATHTAISKRLADKLKLIPVGKTEVNGVNEVTIVNTHLVNITLPNKIGFVDCRVTEALNLGEFDVLIGMDIIMCGDFSVSHANGHTKFSFIIPPNLEHLDYVEILKQRDSRSKLSYVNSNHKTTRKSNRRN